jgi:oligopeptide/dipeptide ABC transporter ATP-binding protein
MYLGELVEVAPTRLLFDAPAHPYTRTLLSAIPTRDPRRRGGRLVLTGDVPSPMNPPSGCRFHTRCPAAFDRCRSEWPEAVEVEPGHTVRCFHVHDLDASRPWLPQVSERIEVACAANRFPKSADEPSVRRKPATTNSPKPRDRATRPVAKASSAPHVWLAATAVGLVLVALGHAISGAAIAVAASWLGIKPRTDRPALLAGALAFGLATSLLASAGIDRLERRWQAEAELESLESQVEARAVLAGAPPAGLDDLGWRLFEVFQDGRPVDPWNRPWQYRVPGGRGAPFDIWSVGPDGVSSADDVSSAALSGDESR